MAGSRPNKKRSCGWNTESNGKTGAYWQDNGNLVSAWRRNQRPRQMFSLSPFRASSTWKGHQRSREDNLMDRRSFILSLIGGAAAASVGAVAMAQATPVTLAPEPVDAKPAEPHAARSLDDADAEFSRYHRRHHRRHYRRHYRRHRRYYRR
jgi:hypothetical protein